MSLVSMSSMEKMVRPAQSSRGGLECLGGEAGVDAVGEEEFVGALGVASDELEESDGEFAEGCLAAEGVEEGDAV